MPARCDRVNPRGCEHEAGRCEHVMSIFCVCARVLFVYEPSVNTVCEQEKRGNGPLRLRL